MSQVPAERRKSDSPPEDFRPSPLFWLLMGAGWLGLLLLGLALPMLGRLAAGPNFLLNMLGYALAAVAMVCASALLALMICRVRLPTVWWMHRIVGRKVNEFEGVFFVGGPVKGISRETQNLIFGAEESMHRWDLAYGLITLALVLPHGAAAVLSRWALTGMFFGS